MPARATPGLIRFNMIITGGEAVAAFTPYVQRYCMPRQIDNLRAGSRVRIDVPTTEAALELWPLVFKYDTPDHLWQLRDVLIAVNGSAPPLLITEQTEIKWLEFGKFERPLMRLGYKTVGDFTATEESQLYAHDGVSTSTVEMVKSRLDAYGFTLFQK